MTFLRMTLDSWTMQASLSADKLARIRERIHGFLVSRATSRKDLQSFISRLLALLPAAPDSDSVVKLDSAAVVDLPMWDEFLQGWNGVSMVIPAVSEFSFQVVTDAAATRGYAAIFSTHWLAGPWPDE